MKKASVDFGFKRTGLAVTDPSGSFVSSIKTVEPGAVIGELWKNGPLSEIIVGFPLNLNFAFTKSTAAAVDMAVEISKSFGHIPVYLVDERFTSSVANSKIEKGSKKRKELVDGLSASILLEDYIHGAKAHRVIPRIPPLSENVIDLFLNLGSFDNVLMLGGALRGLETHIIAKKLEIFEDDPVCFRIRQKNSEKVDEMISLNFGVFWDIILQRLKVIDLLVCEKEHIDRIDTKALDGKLIVVENNFEEGTVSVGGRWLTIGGTNRIQN